MNPFSAVISAILLAKWEALCYGCEMAGSKSNFVRQVVEAIESGPYTRYQIAKMTGIPQSTLSRMVTGNGWLGRDKMNKLAELLGLEVTKKGTEHGKRK